jgi:hypothetical protein
MYEVVGESQKISRSKKEEVKRHNAEVKANITSSDAFKNSAISSAVR